MKHQCTFSKLRVLCTLLIAFWALCQIKAQKMEFSFSSLTGVKSVYLHDGTTLVQLPVGASLANLSATGMSVKADGQTAALTDIVPNPATKTDYVDGALNVFYYKGKAYKVRFAVGEYFTAVFFTDAKMGGLSDINTQLEFYAQRMAAMGHGGVNYTFDALPGYIPKADIAFFMGDMNSSTSPTPIIHTNTTDYMNVVAKCAVVTGQFESYGSNATITEYGLCYSTTANPTTSNTYKAAADIADEDNTFGDELKGMFGVYFDNLTAQTTYHVRAYCKYTVNGTSYTTYGEDRTITTPNPSGMTWAWEGGQTPSAEVKARIEEAMNGAKEYYNNYCTLYKWAGTCYNSGVQTADCSLRADGSCYIRFGPTARYQWVGTAQHELSHGYGVGQTSAYAGYPNPFKFKRATLTLRVFLKDMTMLISHDRQHYWPGGINQREEVTNGTANNKGTYTCKNEEMLKCNAMILNGLALDGMKTSYGAKERDLDPWTNNSEESAWAKGCMQAIEEQTAWATQRIRDLNDLESSQRNNAPRKVTGQTSFENALNAFNQAGIPLILAPGEIDLALAANADGYALNESTLAAITRSVSEAQNHGVSDVTRFSGTALANTVQPQPFAFKFKDVRFYNGMKLWFDKPMYKYSNSSYRYLTPDLILSNLTNYVNNHASETSIWMQHIPFAADDATWLDNTSGTIYRYDNGTTEYSNNAYNATYNAYNTAARRRTKLNSLITSTANAAMFSGHSGAFNDNYYGNSFHDYTVPEINSTPGDAIIVLMKAGKGVIEVKKVDFRNYEPFLTHFEGVATEFTPNENSALLAGLVQGLENLNTGNNAVNSAITNARNVNNAANLNASINALNSAFNSFVTAQSEDVDVSGLLGTNLDFEKPAGTATNSNIHAVEGWNEYVNAASTSWATLKYDNSLASPNGGNALRIRENWKGNPSLPSTLQVYKDAVLPAGSYLIKFEIRQPYNNNAQSLNYYEVNGVRNYISAGTSWETKTIPIKIVNPSTVRLSFGFVGNTISGDNANEVDVDNIQLIYIQQELSQGKASMTEPWIITTAKPDDYSKYFFTIWDHTQDLGMVLKNGNYQNASYNAMWYAENVTPAYDKTALWTFDSNVDGNNEYIIMANASYSDYMLQTEGNQAYFFHTSDNGGNGDLQWGRTLHAYADGKWTIQNGRYPEEGFLGPWEPGVFTETALNKQGANIGYFDIYRILRGEYVANFENLREASQESPLNITYVLENPGGERRSAVGWKVDGTEWWSQTNTSLNGKVGGRYIELWNGEGLPATDLYQVVYGLPDGNYRFSAIAHCTSNCIMYANDNQVDMPTNNPGTRTNIEFTLTGGELRVGFKTGTNPGIWIAFDDAKLEFLGTSLPNAQVGKPTPSIPDGGYIQNLNTITFAFNKAASDSGTFSLLDGSATATFAQNGTTIAQGTLSLSGTNLNAAFTGVTLQPNTTYTLTLPAEVVGYEGLATNEKVTLTYHTPIVFDGTYYLYNTCSHRYISRGGEWATSATMDDWGLALLLITDVEGYTSFKFFDNQNLYLYNDGFCYGDGGTDNRLRFTIQQVEGGYKFLNKNNNRYLAEWAWRAVADAAEGDNLWETSNIWALESTADHVANYTRNADAQAATAAESVAALNGITTKTALESALATGFEAVTVDEKTLTDERFQVYAELSQELQEAEYVKQTVENVKPGLYRLTADAFQRAAYYDWVFAADGARGAIYAYVNGAKTQLMSVTEYASATPVATDWTNWEHNGMYYPNGNPVGHNMLNEGHYRNVVYVYVPADEGKETGTITYGINNPNRPGGDPTGTWCDFTNFKLERLIPKVTLDETSATAPQAMTDVALTFNRSIIAKTNDGSENAWNTICLPFSMDETLIKSTFGENTRVMEMTGVTVSGGNATFTFSQTDAIEANKPYIMQTDQEGTVYTFTGIDITPSESLTVTADGVDFVGNYINQTVLANAGGTDYYILNDQFKSSTGSTKIKGFRAYFHVPTAMGVKSLSLNIDGETTSIDAIDADTAVQLPADIYSVGGQLIRRNADNLDNLPAGVYIVNGKKFIKR